MSEFWFNVNEGKLIVGEAAYEQVIEQSLPGDIVSLPELLTSRDFPFRPGDFEHRYKRVVWSREEKIQLGHWALKLLEQATGEPQVLKTIPHIERLHVLGLSPSPGAWREFGGFDKFRELIGSPMQKYYEFENWSLKDYIDHAHALESELGRMPIKQDFREANGPSPDMIYRRIGGLRKLNDHLGYPNVHEWDKDDYISWGVKVVEVNGPELLVPAAIRTLSKRGRGPTAPTIVNHFDLWSNFKSKVLEEYQWREEDLAAQEAAKLSRYERLADSKKLPTEFREMKKSDFFSIAARYILISRCLPVIPEKMKIKLIQQPSDHLIAAIRKQDSSLTAGQIEVIASSEDIFDDIWPISNENKHLLIDPLELENERKIQRQKKQLPTT